MRKYLVLLGFTCLMLIACKPKKQTNLTTTPPPTLDSKTGIFQSATVYAASTDFEFLVDGKPIFIRVNYGDSTNLPIMPSNLTVMGEEGPPSTNPLLIGKKYELTFGPNDQLKSIQLLDAHDPSSTEIPAIPNQYSGLLSGGVESRAYLNLFSDLTAILLIDYKAGERPLYKVGNWTRTKGGQTVTAQFGDEQWEFLVRENALVLTSNQMGNQQLTLVASDDFDVCHYARVWLSELSTTDGEKRVPANKMQSHTPLSEVLRTEHAYMNLYGELEYVFKASEEEINKGLRANPTVQGVCDLMIPMGGH